MNYKIFLINFYIKIFCKYNLRLSSGFLWLIFSKVYLRTLVIPSVQSKY